MISKIPTSATTKRYSAIVSNRFSFIGFDVRMEKKENIQENVSNIAMTEVSSSM